VLKLLFVALIGRLFLHLIQKFPLPRFLNKYNFIKELHECLLCLGVYVYTFLTAIFRADLLSAAFPELGIGYVPVVSEIITGAVVSWILYVFEIGYRERYLNITIL